MNSRLQRNRSRRHPNLMETLESRLLLSASPSGLMAATVRQAYGFNQLSNNGAGQTIAIVDAYDDPTIAADLNTFDAANGIAGDSSTFFTKVKMSASVAVDGSWAQEISLDVEWAHAIAPGAKIVLVEAANSSINGLFTAVNYARNLAGVSVVSMSWGCSEYSGEKSLDTYFTTPAGHTGVTFVASSGDVGGVANYPATSPNVVAVGGTTLNTSSGKYVSETAWSGSGGGYSTVETAASYQTALTGSTKRSSPDVAYDANPGTGFSVYDSTSYSGQSGWLTFGGTSAGAPQWAALIALADQGRVAAGQGTLDGATQTLPALYAAPAADFHDITSGATGHSISAKAGFDQATGRGSPIANALVPYLMTAYATTTSKAATTATGTTTNTTTKNAAIAAVGDQPVAGSAVVADGLTPVSVKFVAIASPLPTTHASTHTAPVVIAQSTSTRVMQLEAQNSDEIILSIL